MRAVRPLAPALALALLASTVAYSAPPRARAQERGPEPGPRLQWEPYRRVGLPEYAISLSVPLVLRLTNFAVRKPTSPRLGGAVLFDDGVRSALVLDTRAARDEADLFSDISWASSMVYPFADALIVAWGIHGNPDVAWQMVVISSQSLAIAAFISQLGIHHVTRARPSSQQCPLDPSYAPTCNSPSSYHGFPSGHTAGAFAGASLACSQHLNLPLYGGGAPDVAACGLALAWASSSAVARLMADRHWATDVLLGVGLGMGLGWLLPELVYYVDTGTAGSALVMPFATQGHLGLLGVGRL